MSSRDTLIYDVAPALYAGGWRSSDRDLMLVYYNSSDDDDEHFTEEEVDIVCQELARLEERGVCDDDQ